MILIAFFSIIAAASGYLVGVRYGIPADLRFLAEVSGATWASIVSAVAAGVTAIWAARAGGFQRRLVAVEEKRAAREGVQLELIQHPEVNNGAVGVLYNSGTLATAITGAYMMLDIDGRRQEIQLGRERKLGEPLLNFGVHHPLPPGTYVLLKYDNSGSLTAIIEDVLAQHDGKGVKSELVIHAVHSSVPTTFALTQFKTQFRDRSDVAARH